MKKILLIAMSIFTMATFGQTDTTKKHKQLDCYVSGFFATSTGNKIGDASYAGVEAGIGFKNIGFGLSSGRGSLAAAQKETSNLYWYEIKTYAYIPVGSIKCFIIAGWGQYYNTTQSFIEYGAGFSYSVKKFDLGMTISNWNNAWYVSPGVTYNFSLGRNNGI
jgi:hypothetical protein